jgi:hypothetical protein
MTGPATYVSPHRRARRQKECTKLTENHRPGQEGPSFAPPPLPEGWIAQWDGMSKKYYFVQLSTGASQWDTPTHAAPTGPTPQATPQGGLEHPYGTPDNPQPEIVTNQDGSQSIRHPDGSLEPYTTDRSLSGNIGVGFSYFRFAGRELC